MTEISKFIELMAFAATAFISFFCCLTMLLNRFDTNGGRQPKRISFVLMGVFFCPAFAWFTMLFYDLHPNIFVYLHSGTYLCMLYFEVLLYYFVFQITRTSANEHFSVWHFIVPAVIVGTLIVWSFFVPFHVQLYIIKNKGMVLDGYLAYTLLHISDTTVFFIYNIIYSLLCLRKIKHYQKVFPDYSADEGHSPVRWLYLLFYASLGSIPVVLMGSFSGNNIWHSSLIILIPTLMAIFQVILICYNVVASNFKIIESEKTTIPDKNNLPAGKIDKAKFEFYLRIKKPYRDPDLHITDMTAELKTNRTYLSAFINREYGMNFSRYINHLRLKELARLRIKPENAGLNGLELVRKAGFSNYKGYARIKDKEDKETTLKME